MGSAIIGSGQNGLVRRRRRHGIVGQEAEGRARRREAGVGERERVVSATGVRAPLGNDQMRPWRASSNDSCLPLISREKKSVTKTVSSSSFLSLSLGDRDRPRVAADVDRLDHGARRRVDHRHRPDVWLATNRSFPVGVSAQPRGSVPTGMVATTLKAASGQRDHRHRAAGGVGHVGRPCPSHRRHAARIDADADLGEQRLGVGLLLPHLQTASEFVSLFTTRRRLSFLASVIVVERDGVERLALRRRDSWRAQSPAPRVRLHALSSPVLLSPVRRPRAGRCAISTPLDDDGFD
jgi:hypothetical protein